MHLLTIQHILSARVFNCDKKFQDTSVAPENVLNIIYHRLPVMSWCTRVPNLKKWSSFLWRIRYHDVDDVDDCDNDYDEVNRLTKWKGMFYRIYFDFAEHHNCHICILQVLLFNERWATLFLHWWFSVELGWSEKVLWEKVFNFANHYRQ